MKAWRFYGFGDMRLDEVAEPPRLPDHVIAQPLVVQPSVTEAQLAQGIPTLAYDRVKRGSRPRRRCNCSVTSFARIVEVGSDVTRFHPGDRVAARAKLPCGACPQCRSERSHLCRLGPVLGFDLPGCFAQLASLPEIALVKVDDRISDSEAACLQSLSDSVAAVETAGLAMGDTVVIFGQGSMGLECLQVARLSGAGQIITVDVRDEACAISKKLGADFALNARSGDVVAAIRDLTGGIGADVVFECAGGSPKQGLAGHRDLEPGDRRGAFGGKDRGRLLLWRAGGGESRSDARSAACDTSFLMSARQAHLQHTVRLVASGRIRMKSTITHVLEGIENVPQAFEITAHKGKYLAINPAQVVIAR